MNAGGGIGNAITLLDKLESALQSMRAIVDIFFGFVAETFSHCTGVRVIAIQCFSCFNLSPNESSTVLLWFHRKPFQYVMPSLGCNRLQHACRCQEQQSVVIILGFCSSCKFCSSCSMQHSNFPPEPISQLRTMWWSAWTQPRALHLCVQPLKLPKLPGVDFTHMYHQKMRDGVEYFQNFPIPLRLWFGVVDFLEACFCTIAEWLITTSGTALTCANHHWS